MVNEPTYNIENAEHLNKFLLGTLREIKTKQVSIEEASVISKVADKVIKHNLTRILYKKLTHSQAPIEFFEGSASKEFMIPEGLGKT